MVSMGLDPNLSQGKYCKRNFRWVFYIPDVCGYDGSSTGINVLPPQKSARPNLQFKEMQVNHLSEDVYYPAKPDWKPITVVLYDLQMDIHPVFQWINQFYDPGLSWGLSNQILYAPNNGLIKHTGNGGDAALRMYNGCGEIVETWYYEDAWPQSVNFQTLDMSDSGVTLCELTLRYSRAFIQY